MSDTIKVVLVGNSGVGKTSYLVRFTDNFFTMSHTTTIGVDFRTKYMIVNDNPVTLHIWDTAGQERYRAIGHNYYAKAEGVIIMYDCLDKSSFDELAEWHQQVTLHAVENPALIVIANK